MPTSTPVRLETLPGWAQELLAEARVARLGYVDEDDHPRVLPVTFAVAAGAVWSAIDEKPKRSAEPARLRHLRRRPEAALLVDLYDDDWSRLAWVQLLGTVDVLPAGLRAGGDGGACAQVRAIRRAHAAGAAPPAECRSHPSVALGREPAARPLAPRAGIEAAGPEAGHLRREQDDTGGHARTAVGHQLPAGRGAGGRERRAQLLGRQKAALGASAAKGRFTAPGMWPATGSIGSSSPR